MLVLLTGEYPPYRGGVADYTWQLAEGLKELGLEVVVIVFQSGSGPADSFVHFVGPAANPMSMRRASLIIRHLSGDRILLAQYVPQMYGLKGMNVAFVCWISRLGGCPLWVMFHEVCVDSSSGSSWKHRVLSMVTRGMAQRLAWRADRCFVSTSSFADIIKLFRRPGVQVDWLPIPSNLPVESDQREVDRLRPRLLEGNPGPLVGHFGTYGTATQPLLLDFVRNSGILHPLWKLVFIGRGSLEFTRTMEAEGFIPPGRAVSSGATSPSEAACWISACDVMVQPYPDGASTRRTTLMAALALGKATVTNLGHLSDGLWAGNSALRVVGSPDAAEMVNEVARVLADASLRTRLEADAAQYYTQQFSLSCTIDRLATLIKEVQNRASASNTELRRGMMDR